MITPTPFDERGAWRRYTTADGLAANQTEHIVEDGDGQFAAELAVADTGIGIALDGLPHIFDEFRQVARKGSTAQEGTGLGLAIVKRSAELVGGSVAVASTEGVGTAFTLRIPDLATTRPGDRP